MKESGAERGERRALRCVQVARAACRSMNDAWGTAHKKRKTNSQECAARHSEWLESSSGRDRPCDNGVAAHLRECPPLRSARTPTQRRNKRHQARTHTQAKTSKGTHRPITFPAAVAAAPAPLAAAAHPQRPSTMPHLPRTERNGGHGCDNKRRSSWPSANGGHGCPKRRRSEVRREHARSHRNRHNHDKRLQRQGNVSASPRGSGRSTHLPRVLRPRGREIDNDADDSDEHEVEAPKNQRCKLHPLNVATHTSTHKTQALQPGQYCRKSRGTRPVPRKRMSDTLRVRKNDAIHAAPCTRCTTHGDSGTP